MVDHIAHMKPSQQAVQENQDKRSCLAHKYHSVLSMQPHAQPAQLGRRLGVAFALPAQAAAETPRCITHDVSAPGSYAVQHVAGPAVYNYQLGAPSNFDRIYQ
jgi:hypothetical protein